MTRGTTRVVQVPARASAGPADHAVDVVAAPVALAAAAGLLVEQRLSPAAVTASYDAIHRDVT